MTTPLSINLANAIVPINDSIPSRRMMSRKARDRKRSDSIATLDIKLIPMESKAITLSGIDGPLNNRKMAINIENIRKAKAPTRNVSNII